MHMYRTPINWGSLLNAICEGFQNTVLHAVLNDSPLIICAWNLTDFYQTKLLCSEAVISNELLHVDKLLQIKYPVSKRVNQFRLTRDVCFQCDEDILNMKIWMKTRLVILHTFHFYWLEMVTDSRMFLLQVIVLKHVQNTTRSLPEVLEINTSRSDIIHRSVLSASPYLLE
jgi:hypothetical protein